MISIHPWPVWRRCRQASFSGDGQGDFEGAGVVGDGVEDSCAERGLAGRQVDGEIELEWGADEVLVLLEGEREFEGLAADTYSFGVGVVGGEVEFERGGAHAVGGGGEGDLSLGELEDEVVGDARFAWDGEGAAGGFCGRGLWCWCGAGRDLKVEDELGGGERTEAHRVLRHVEFEHGIGWRGMLVVVTAAVDEVEATPVDCDLD